ncbi:esterase C25G4.2 [Capsicum annuum]|uniref:esterase C25G4.2 n=1 Tax=Capsicum annuum TaxID=4072 RepID=UPI001FB0E2C9|nr:esterase C25G4.2 [Capsicum annuum]
MEVMGEKKMKILCLHGFRTSGNFLRKQISKWDPSIFAHFEMEFPDGIFPAGGKSEIESIFPPPYFEWFQYNEEFTEYENLEECISYLCEYITTKGPFDGLLGFSQGATLSALLLGYMEQGKILKEQPPMKLFVSVSGAKFRDPSIGNVAYKDVIKVKSVHFIGEKDWLKIPSQELTTAFQNPLIIRHPQGHTVPRLDDAALETLKTCTRDIVLSSTQSCLGGGPNEACKHVNIENLEEDKKLEKPNKVEIQKIIWLLKENKPNQVQVKEQVKQLGCIHHSMSLLYKRYLNQKQKIMNIRRRTISKEMIQMLIAVPPKSWLKPSALIVIL